MQKAIAITGASSGIGRALAINLAGPGKHLYLLARREVELHELATTLQSLGARTTVYPIDFATPGAYQEFHQHLQKNKIFLDEFYHFAAQISMGAVHHTLWKDWTNIYHVNLLSTSEILSTTYPKMVRQGHGKIILISSMAPFGGYPMSAPYAATKTAIYGIFKSLQHESKRTGVSLHLVCPSFVDTPLFENFILRKVTLQQIRHAILAIRLPITAPKVAAQQIADKVAKGKQFIIFPFILRLLIFLIRRFPFVSKPFIHRALDFIGYPKS
ncbi:SDR family oxidoreductase [Akkermansiaceae bacterium]|nr:SDR family oxidoreductase [Akkermansiaceae bacterium]MDB4537270.1 SDR family oxidoreductase [Akkermansiaceae bacterium]